MTRHCALALCFLAAGVPPPYAAAQWRVGLDLGVLTSPMAFRQMVEAVPFYSGLTLEAIGGRGVRWVEREAATGFPSPGTRTLLPELTDTQLDQQGQPASSPSIMKRTPMLPRNPSIPPVGPTSFTCAAAASIGLLLVRQ